MPLASREEILLEAATRTLSEQDADEKAGEAVDRHDHPIDRLKLHGLAGLGRRGVLVVIFDLLDQEAPGFVLARASRFPHRDLKIAEFALNLLARQHVHTACEDRRLDYRGLSAVEAFE